MKTFLILFFFALSYPRLWAQDKFNTKKDESLIQASDMAPTRVIEVLPQKPCQIKEYGTGKPISKDELLAIQQRSHQKTNASMPLPVAKKRNPALLHSGKKLSPASNNINSPLQQTNPQELAAKIAAQEKWEALSTAEKEAIYAQRRAEQGKSQVKSERKIANPDTTPSNRTTTPASSYKRAPAPKN